MSNYEIRMIQKNIWQHSTFKIPTTSMHLILNRDKGYTAIIAFCLQICSLLTCFDKSYEAFG